MFEERLSRIIEDFDHRNLNLFFRSKCENYAEAPEDLSQYDDERFMGFQKLGEIRFDNGDKLVITSALVGSDLSERSGKKAQYEKAKKILKELAVYDAGFFIFHDNTGSFRFSLVYAQFQGTKRGFSNFRRFTYFISKDQTNKTFRVRVGGCTFISLEAVKDAFSVEKVNKEFYNHIARFFYQLTGYECKREMTLPSVSDDDKETYQEFAVRLIGRTIFCWFLKHKKSANGVSLIPESILSSEAVKQNSQYYHSTLEKLFFEVLNTPQEQRHKNILPDADNIPFLNGGLFEPHRDDFYSGKPLYNLVIPDTWFEQFFEILEQYNFTIDENSTVDADVSVDPEMLGRIFENLLAEVNPETGETARKATGSYYTPRTIVDYMVDQSLKQYLITKTKIDEDRITALLSYEAPEVDLTESEKGSIISALDEIKIIDPACGSGAFPMGILHKMLLVLQKADPDLKLWLKNHLGNIEPGLFKDRLLERIRNENWEYVRKLLIIQKSVYGVDIQTIAVEISKLRFFLSLIVDEQIDDLKNNRGVEALPNLEFKFVAANSLIGLPPVMNRQVGLGIVNEEVVRLKELRNKYLRSYGTEKKQIEEDFLDTRGKLIEQNINWGSKDALALQLANWNPFSNEASDWFDPDWMFGEDSFDIVIANPPYIQLSKVEGIAEWYKKYLRNRFHTSGGRLNTFIFFIHLGMDVLRNGGNLAYIIPNTILTQEYYSATREHLLKNNYLRTIVQYTGLPFENAVVENVTIIASKQKLSEYSIEILRDNLSEIELVDRKNNIEFLTNRSFSISVNSDIVVDKVFSQYDSTLDTFCEVNQAIALKGDKKLSLKESNPDGKYYRLLDGRNIGKYSITWGGVYLDYRLNRIHSCKRKDIFQSSEKLFFRRVSENLIFTYDDEQYFALNTLVVVNLKKGSSVKLKCLLAILNSRLVNYVYRGKFKSTKKVFSEIQARTVGALPIPDLDSRSQQSLIMLVDQTLAAKKCDPQTDTRAFEAQIDQVVYELYGLTPEEIAVVEGKV